MMRGEGKRWCILRTKQRDTVRLADSLAEDGFGVWIPRATEKVEVKGTKREVVRAMLPGFVFAEAHYLVDLLQLAAMPVKPRRGEGLLKPAHKGFSLLRTVERIHLASDSALEALRRAEKRAAKPAWAQRAFRRGQMVRAGRGTGGYEGMCGIVRDSNCKATVVCFDRWMHKVEIPTSLLTEDEAYGLQSATDVAREAA
jgi:hypothetical protein